MSHSRILIAVLLLFDFRLNAQTNSAVPLTDVLIFANGEKLIGQLVRSTDKIIIFKSDMAGEVTADWQNVTEFHSSRAFVVVKKGTRLGRGEDPQKILSGTISVDDQRIQLQTTGDGHRHEIPVDQTSDIVDIETFQKGVIDRPGLFAAWQGSVTVGASLIAATQKAQSYTSSLSLTRTVPTETWADPSNRTLISFTSSYGKLNQPGIPSVKTNLFHASAERDQYFSPRAYAFMAGGYDHDYSQGLDLQQTYGSGVGWTVVKAENDELDLRAELTFVRQAFLNPDQNRNLFGSIFSEGFSHTFRRKLILREKLGISPAWSQTSASSATASMDLSMPILKKIGATVSVLDNFLGDPSPGFRKNAFQFVSGLTYTVH